MQELQAPFFWISEKDKGIYDAMNKGVAVATGEWLYFLGADDQLYNAEVLTKIAGEMTTDIPLILGSVQYLVTDIKPFILNSDQQLKLPSWSWKIWFRNAAHHQGTFFHRELFHTHTYQTNYKILADYALNLELYIKNTNCKLTEIVVAKCSANGISKQGGWNLYKEEIRLKTQSSSIIFTPVFFGIALLKFIARKLQNAKY